VRELAAAAPVAPMEWHSDHCALSRDFHAVAAARPFDGVLCALQTAIQGGASLLAASPSYGMKVRLCS